MLESDKINVIVVKNPFNIDDRETYNMNFDSNKSVYEYVQPYMFGIENLAISVNGLIIEQEESKTTFLQSGDCLAVCECVQGGGGGGKNILSTIAGIALSVWVGGLGTAGIWGIRAGSFAMGLVQTGLMLIGGALINAIFPVASSDEGNTTEDTSSSNSTYNWGQLNSINGQGGAFARTYGTVKTAGTLLASHITSDGEKQYLNLLYTGGQGPASKIENIKIDGNPIENYVDVQYETKLGTNTQTPVSYFDYTYDDQQLSYALDLAEDKVSAGLWHTQRTEGNGGEGLEVTIGFSNGLYHIDDNGSKSATAVSFDLQYKKVGDTEWSSYGTTYTTIYKWRNTVTGEHYDINDSRIIHKGSRNYIVDYAAGIEEGEVKRIEVEQIAIQVYSGDYVTISALYESTYYITYRIDNLPKGQYDVRMRCRSKAGTTSRHINTFYFSELSHVIYKRFSRPNKILVAIRALATDQLSGSAPTITWEQTVENVNVFNPTTNAYEEKPATNPAWAVYDMFHSTQHLENPNNIGTFEYLVSGCKAERLDYYRFLSWAERCATMKFTFNYIYDSTEDMWSAVQKAEVCGRGKVVLKGTYISCVHDGPKTPQQMFTVANVIQDSFSEAFLSVSDRANAVEVSFNNKEKDYEKDIAVCYGSNWDNEEENSTQVTLYGCDNYEEAFRYANYAIRCNEYFVRTVTFKADVDSIACQVGDAILLQSDVFNWGVGGRLEEFTTDSITLNEPTVLTAGKNYAFIIRYKDGTKVTKTTAPITTTNTYSVVPLSSALSIMPEKYDVYAFGEVGKTVKQMIVSAISRTSDTIKTLTCAEFDDNVYNEDAVVTIDEVTTTSSITLSNIFTEEDGYTVLGGGHIASINLTFNVLNPLKQRQLLEIQYSTDNVVFSPLISTKDSTYTMQNVTIGKYYYFRGRPISTINTPLGGWTYSSAIYITGTKDSLPAPITDLVVVQRGNDIVVNGAITKELDFSHVEIRVDGSGWEDAVSPIGNESNSFPMTISGIYDGTHIFRAKAVDNGGNKSLAEDTYILTVSGANIYKNIILEVDDISSPTSLTLTNLVALSNGTIIAPYSLTYGDVSTYGELPIETYTKYSEGTMTSIIESGVIDTYKDGRTGVGFDFKYLLKDVNATYGSFINRTYGDYKTDTYGSITVVGDVSIQVRFSEDNVTWTPYQNYINGEYFFRYIQYKLALNYEGASTRVSISSLKQYYDVPDQEFSKVLPVPDTGLNVVFNALDSTIDFYSTPTQISATVVGGSGNVFPDVTNASADGLTLKCYNREGTLVSGTINLYCKGY